MTGDGSPTLFLPDKNEYYHSHFGAVTESKHIFIQAGLHHFTKINPKREISILEVGMGTGLNVFLAFLFSNAMPSYVIQYTAIEPEPVDPVFIQQLNYPLLLGAERHGNVFKGIHTGESNVRLDLSEKFSLNKKFEKIQTTDLKEKFDMVFFDAFAPAVQPELWEKGIFDKIFQFLNSGGILVTYCAKGEVKRILRSSGFGVENLPGPPGKREMTRASKPV